MPDLRLAPAGLLLRIERRAHLERLRRRIVVAFALGWLPVYLLCAIEWAVTGRADPLVRDLSAHARLLIGIPLLLAAQDVLGYHAHNAVVRLVDEGLVPDERRPRLESIVRLSNRLSTSLLPDLVLLSLTLLLGIATLAGWIHPTRSAGSIQATKITAARICFSAVGLPLFQFMLGRTIWIWGIWNWTLLRLARVGLRHQPGHPDRRGGIGFLAFPSLVFHAVFLFATSCILSGSWATAVLFAGAKVTQFKNVFIAFAILGELLAFAPLLVFTPRLYFVGRQGRREFGGLATEYVRRFRRRWTTGPHDDPLGTPDIQSLNDLNGAYRESAEKNRLLLFSPPDLGVLLAVMLVPMVPLLLTVMPVDELLGKLGGLVLGAH